jgi:hypothetical protein
MQIKADTLDAVAAATTILQQAHLAAHPDAVPAVALV